MNGHSATIDDQPPHDRRIDRDIARNRYSLFGKRETCLVPNAALAARFLA